ncbi:MAG: molecular chaperone DnaJ [Pseudomonadota bacterium]
MIWLFGVAFLAIIGWLAKRWLVQADPKLVKQGLAGFVLLLLCAVTIILLVTGRASAALPFLLGCFVAYQRLRTGLGLATFLKRLWDASQGRKTATWASRIETDYLSMALDQKSGQLSGSVLKGLYAGQDLANLSRQQLLEKHQELQKLDFESARLLEAFIDRAYGNDWRGAGSGGPGSSSGARSGAAMTVQEAADILGVPIRAERAEILAAHKRLMKVAHPDQGGSDFLATQINAAKDVLLKFSQ